MERQNVTLSLPKAVLKKAKMLALKEGKSLSELIIEAIEERISKNTEYREAMETEIRRMKKGLRLGTGGRMPCARKDMYEL